MLTARSDQRRQKELQDALKFINHGANGFAEKRVVLPLHVDTILREAYQTGLLQNDLSSVVEAVTTRRFNESVTIKLVRSLVPAQLVPEDCVIRLLSWISTGQASYNIRGWVLRWIVVIYDYIDERRQLHSLYALIFHFLHSDTLRYTVCHLLYLVTRKEDCTQYRAKQLMKLRSSVGSEPRLDNLLSLYKLFYPNCLPVLPINKTFYRNTDRKWSDSVKAVQERNRSLDGHPDTSLDDHPRLHVQSPTKPPKPKRRKVSIPEITRPYLDVDEWESTGLNYREEPLAFVMIKSFSDMCRNIHRLQVPGRVGSVLNDLSLQHYVSAIRDVIVNQRLCYWLQHTLYEVFFNVQSETPDIDKHNLLQAVTHYSSFLQESIPVCGMFLESYLMHWDGLTHRRHMFSLLTHYTRVPFHRLKNDVLDPLFRLYFTSPPQFKCELLSFMTRWLRQMVTSEWTRFMEQRDRMDLADDHMDRLFHEPDDEEPNPDHTIYSLILYMDGITRLTLLSDHDNVVVIYSLLSFYEFACSLHLRYNLRFVHLLPPALVYAAVFTSQSICLDSAFHILALHKRSVVSLKQRAPTRHHSRRRGMDTTAMTRRNDLVTSLVPITVPGARPTARGLVKAFTTPTFVTGRGYKATLAGLCTARHPAWMSYIVKHAPQKSSEQLQRFMDALSSDGFTGLEELISARQLAPSDASSQSRFSSALVQ